jgi:trimethylamine--corrinoid protein Co-methyltransferase
MNSSRYILRHWKSLRKEALRILGDSGAIVDVKNRIVKFPAYLVEDSLGSAPPTVFLAGREDKHDIVLESSRVGFTAFGEGIILVDRRKKKAY